MLNGSAQIDYPPRGLRAVLRFPRKAPDHTTSFSNADL
jgi:hypothetical protein